MLPASTRTHWRLLAAVGMIVVAAVLGRADPGARQNGCVFTYNNLFYLLGGDGLNGTSNDAFAYTTFPLDPNNAVHWQAVGKNGTPNLFNSTLPVNTLANLLKPCVVTPNGTLIVGGNDFIGYDIPQDKWLGPLNLMETSTIAPAPLLFQPCDIELWGSCYERYVKVQDSLWIFQNVANSIFQPYTDIYILNLTTFAWSPRQQRGPIPTMLLSTSLIYLAPDQLNLPNHPAGIILMVGGQFNNTYNSTIWVFDLDTNSWSISPQSLLVAVDGAKLFYYQPTTTLYIFPGGTTNQIPTNAMQWLNLSSNGAAVSMKVTTQKYQPSARIGANAVQHGNTFVVYGGNNGSANDDQFFIFNMSTTPIGEWTRYAAATTLTTTTALPTVIPTAAGAGTSASASPSVTPDPNFNMIAFAGGMAGAVVFLALVLGAGLFYRQRRTKTTPSDSVIATQKRPFRGDQSDEVFQPFMASSGTPLQSPAAYEDTMSSPTTSSSPNGFFSFRSRKTPPARGAEPYAPTRNASFQSMPGFTFGNASPDPGPSAAAVKESFFTFLFRSITTPKRGVEPYTAGQNDNPSMSRNGTTSVVRSRTYRNADHDSVSSFTIIPPAPPNPPLHLHKQSSFVVMPQGEKYQVVPSPLSTSEPGTIVLREIEPKEEEAELRRRVQPVVKEQQWWEEAKRPPGRPSKSAGKPADKARAVEVKTGKLGRPVEEVGVGKPVGKPVEEVGVWKPIGKPVEEVEVKPVGRPVDEVGLGKPVGRPVEEVGVKKSVGRPVDEVGLRKPVVRPVYEVRAALGTTMEKSGAMDRMSAGSKMGNLADDAVIIDSMKKEGYQHANFEGMEKERHQHGNFVA